MNIVIILMVIALMGCTIYLVVIAAKAASDPTNPFGPVEFAVSAMAMLCCSILISYFAIVHVVMAPDDTVTQSSHTPEHFKSSHHKVYMSRKDIREEGKRHSSMRWIKTR